MIGVVNKECANGPGSDFEKIIRLWPIVLEFGMGIDPGLFHEGMACNLLLGGDGLLKGINGESM